MASLAESMILLVKVHKDYYSQYPLISWIYGSEAYKHFFRAVWQINADFDFAELNLYVIDINLNIIMKLLNFIKNVDSQYYNFSLIS
ncbi:unnamed protein product [Rhizophagus irregularis]|nr:unnamed protein product [Rhizophagus irregularis]